MSLLTSSSSASSNRNSCFSTYFDKSTLVLVSCTVTDFNRLSVETISVSLELFSFWYQYHPKPHIFSVRTILFCPVGKCTTFQHTLFIGLFLTTTRIRATPPPFTTLADCGLEAIDSPSGWYNSFPVPWSP